MLISLLFSAVNGGSRRTDARRVGGVPRFSELVVDFGKEGGRALAGGLLAPRKKPLVQPAARRLLRRRPLELELTTAFDITWTRSSSVLGLAVHEEDGSERTGSVIEPDNSSASEAARERLSSMSSSLAPNEIMSLAAEEGR